MISKEEFISECDKIIPPEEIERYNKCKKRRRILLLTILAVEVVIWLIYIYFKGFSYISLGVLGFVMIISLIIIIVATRYHWADFKNKYGQKALEILLKGYKFMFKPQSGVPSNLLNNSGFCGRFEKCTSEDLLILNIPKDDGTPSDVEFMMSDLYATKTETRVVTSLDSKGRPVTRTETYTKILYSGMLGYIKFPFEFKCNLSLNASYPTGERIKLEDIKFNKTFKVHTDNQLEALVVLTPTIMEKLKALSSRFNGLKFSLKKCGELYIGADENMFELKKKAKPTGEVFEYFYVDVVDILSIIKEIKENNKVFQM